MMPGRGVDDVAPQPDATPALLLDVGADVVDRLLDRGDLLRFLVGDLGLVDAELLGDDLLDPLFDVFHSSPPKQGWLLYFEMSRLPFASVKPVNFTRMGVAAPRHFYGEA